MSNVAVALPVPSANGVGATVATPTMGPDKTVVVNGNIEAVIAVQISEDGVSFATVLTFTGPGQQSLPGTVAAFMRVTVSGYKRGSGDCSVGAELGVNDFVAVPVPAGNGAGAAVDVSAFGSRWTVVVGELGSFLGVLAIEVSQDGVNWAQAFGSFTGPGTESRIVSADWIRVRRSGFSVYAPGPMSVALGAFRVVSGGTATDFIQAGAGAVLRTAQDKEREFVSVLDFLDGADVRSAIIDAMAYLATVGGGTLRFPKSAVNYDVDNTGLGAIQWTSDGIIWEGDSIDASHVRNVSTDGTGFIEFDGGANSIQRCGWWHMFLDSVDTAGLMFGFVQRGLSFSNWVDVRVWQKSTTAGILWGTFAGSGGMLENTFLGIWEHGEAGSPAQVNAFKIDTQGSLYSVNRHWMLRVNCHMGEDYFFWINQTGAGTWAQGNEFVIPNCEGVRRGLLRLSGCRGSYIARTTFFDSTIQDGDCYLLDDGSGGRNCAKNEFHGIKTQGGDLVGVFGTDVPVLSLTQVGGLATCQTTIPHNLVDNMCAFIDDANEVDYNGRTGVINVTGADTFTFDINPAAPAAATGAITAARAAMDVLLTGAHEGTVFRSMAGNPAHPLELDFSGRPVSYHDFSEDTIIYRESPNGYRQGFGNGENDLLIKNIIIDKIEPYTLDYLNWAQSGYYSGGRIFWVSASFARVLGPGRCRSADDSWVIDWTGSLTADITVAGVNGLDTGAEAPSTWYYLYVIADSTDTLVTAVILSTSSSAPDLTGTGYDKYRRVGAFYNTAGSDFRKFRVKGGPNPFPRIYWDDDLANLIALSGGSAVAFTTVNLRAWMPETSQLASIMGGFLAPTVGGAATDELHIRPVDFVNADGPFVFTPGNTLAAPQRFFVIMPTSNVQTVEYLVTDADDDAYLWVLGYEDAL